MRFMRLIGVPMAREWLPGAKTDVSEFGETENPEIYSSFN
jgi:hypothetical protein